MSGHGSRCSREPEDNDSCETLGVDATCLEIRSDQQVYRGFGQGFPQSSASRLWSILLLLTLWAHPAEECRHGDTELFRQLCSSELAAIPQSPHPFILLFRCFSPGSPERRREACLRA
jgi:hypothetical protein